MDDIMTSIKELRKTLDGKIESCITKEKAEKLVEDVINRLHPSASKAVLPSSESDVLERYSAFKRKSSVGGEEKWTSEYGSKFGNMKNFLLAAKNRNSVLNDFKSVLSEGASGATGGGYLVPTEFSAQVIRMMNESSPIMQIANILPMSSWKRQIPKQMTNLQVGWVAENGVKGISNPTFGQLEQTAKVLATVIKCTDELIRDSAINLTQFLSELVAEAMALEIERVALLGGSSDPFTGVLHASGANKVGMSGDNVSFDDIANLIFSLSEANSKDGVIVLSRAGLNKLMKLKDSNGNYIWAPPSMGSPATIWNTPYVVSSQIPNTVTQAGALSGGDATIAFFGRFNKNLLISPREEMTVKVSQDAASWNSESSGLDSAFMMDQTWLRFTQALSIDVTFGSAFSYLIFK